MPKYTKYLCVTIRYKYPHMHHIFKIRFNKDLTSIDVFQEVSSPQLFLLESCVYFSSLSSMSFFFNCLVDVPDIIVVNIKIY
jgi:hypothetical protein